MLEYIKWRFKIVKMKEILYKRILKKGAEIISKIEGEDTITDIQLKSKASWAYTSIVINELTSLKLIKKKKIGRDIKISLTKEGIILKSRLNAVRKVFE